MWPPWYTEWKKLHCELLAINNGVYSVMLNKLWPYFEKHEVGPGELAAATERFIHRPDQVSDSWGSHYGYLMEHVREMRKEAKAHADFQARTRQEEEWVKEWQNRSPQAQSFDLAALRAKIGKPVE